MRVSPTLVLSLLINILVMKISPLSLSSAKNSQKSIQSVIKQLMQGYIQKLYFKHIEIFISQIKSYKFSF